MKIRLQLSPASRLISLQWEAMGLQPWATLFPASPFITASGASNPLYAPRKLSLSVSKPSIGLFTE